MDRLLDFITQVVCVFLIVGALGFIGTIATIALAGPHLPDLLKGLPW